MLYNALYLYVFDNFVVCFSNLCSLFSFRYHVYKKYQVQVQVQKKKSTLVSSSSNVGDHAVNLEKDYEETSNEKDIDQGSTIEEDKLAILLLTYTIFRQIDNKIEERYLNVIVLSPKIIYFYQVV
jgi:hypothetical protein